MRWLGYPALRYRGSEKGQSPDEGFDCSGFVKFALTRTGILTPNHIRHASEFFDHFGVLIHWGFHKTGDLVVFSRNGCIPTHIGIVVEKDTFIHSPGRDGTRVTLSKLAQRPIDTQDDANAIYSINPIGFKRIAIKEGRWYKFIYHSPPNWE